MEKNTEWINHLPDALKSPFKTMYDLIFKQDDKIKELEKRLKDAESKLDETQKELAKTAEVAEKAVVRAEKAENKIEKLEHKTDVANKFIAAMTESQDFDKTMEQVESMTKQTIGCEKATFYRLDEGSNKFYNSDGNYRDWTSYQDAGELRSTLISGETTVMENKALIPVLSESDKPIGVIVAENSEGFENAPFEELGKGSQFANNVALAIERI